MIREEKTALILVGGCALAAVLLYLTVLRPALEKATRPSEPSAAASGPAGGPGGTGGTGGTGSPASPPDTRPRSVRRMVSATAWVRDAETGAPLSAAKPIALGVADIAEPAVRVDDAGAATIDYLPPETPFGVRFEHDGYRPVERSGLRAKSSQIVDLGLVLLRPNRVAGGRVLDLAGKPIAGATVSLHRRAPLTADLSDADRAATLAGALFDAPVASDRTADDGTFSIGELDPGLYCASIAAPGFTGAALPALDLRRGDETVTVRLAPGVHAAGRVRIADRGTAGPGRLLAIAADACRVAPVAVASAAVDGGGRFELASVLPAEHWLFLAAEGAGTRPVGPLTIAADSVLDPSFAPSATLSVAVVDAARAPVAGAAVRIESGTPGAREVVATTDARGIARVEIDRGPADLVVEAEGFAASRQVVGIEALASEQRVRLESGRALQGVVRDASGAPLLGAVVTVRPSGPRAVTDRFGAFRLEHAAPSGVRLHAEAIGFVPKDMDLDDAAAPLEIALTKGGTLDVLVRGKNGAPLEGAAVVALIETKDGVELAATTRSDATGAASFACLDPAQRFVLLASTADDAPLRSQPIALAADRSDVRAGLSFLQGGTIAGAVLDDSDRPLAGVLVRAVPVSTDRVDRLLVQNAGAIALTGADGLFRIERLPPGQYRVDASDGKHVAASEAPVQSRDGRVTSGLSLVLASGRSIAGVVQDDAGHAAPFASVTLAGGDPDHPVAGLPRTMVTDAAGRFVFAGVAQEPFRQRPAPVIDPSNPTATPPEPPPLPPYLVLSARRAGAAAEGETPAEETPVDPARELQELRLSKP